MKWITIYKFINSSSDNVIMINIYHVINNNLVSSKTLSAINNGFKDNNYLADMFSDVASQYSIEKPRKHISSSVFFQVLTINNQRGGVNNFSVGFILFNECFPYSYLLYCKHILFPRLKNSVIVYITLTNWNHYDDVISDVYDRQQDGR